MSAAAGWYADPTDAASVRYWDGTGWTTHTRPAPRDVLDTAAASTTASADTGAAGTSTAPTAAPARAGAITVSDGITDAGPTAATPVTPPPTPAGGLLFTATPSSTESDLASRVVSAPATTGSTTAPAATPVPTVAVAEVAAVHPVATPSPVVAATPDTVTAPTPVDVAPPIATPATPAPSAVAPPVPAPVAVPAPPASIVAASVAPSSAAIPTAQPAVAAPAAFAEPVPIPAATPAPPPEAAPAPVTVPVPVPAAAIVAVAEPAVVSVASAPVSNASALATVDESIPIPTLAPAPVATRVVVSPSVVAPDLDPVPAPAPAPAPAVAAASAYAAPPQHGGASVALLERPAESYADPYADAVPAAATSSFGGGATPSVFGGAPAKGFGTSQGGFGTFAGDGPSAASSYRPERHLGRTLLILGLVLVAVAAAAVFGVPRYLDGKAAAAAAEQPSVLTHSAPSTLAGLRRMGGQTALNNAVAAQMKSSGSAWAWAATYGTRANAVSYVAFDMPVADRPQAFRALTNHGQAVALIKDLGAKIATASGGTELMGEATEFASPVGGKIWCMPVTISGNSGGMCLWTNGKEGLASVALPGVMDSAAKSTLVALGQLGKLSTRR